MPASNRALVIVIFALTGLAVHAEFDSALFQANIPQAQSRQELDAYFDVALAVTPQEVLTAVTRFQARFPSSEFTSHVYRMEMLARADLNDRTNVLAAGRKALALNPHDVETLVTLARAIAGDANRGGTREAELGQAETYARNALREIEDLKAPRTLALATWESMIARMKSSAHESLGAIAFERREFGRSVAEFEECTKWNTAPDGGQHYRLGVAYLAESNRDRAIKAFRQAAALGPDAVRIKAEKQLSALGQPRPE